MRKSWTDDRMDDLVKRVDEGFEQVREDNRELRRETINLGSELRHESKALASELREANKALAGELRMESRTSFDALNARFDALQRTLIAAILAGFLGVIVSNVT